MKKQKTDDYARLLHIKDAIEGIQRFIEGYNLDTFIADEKTFLATVKEIEIIGEAAYRLSDTLKKQYSNIPWQQIESMRHKLVHDYYDIDKKVAWQVATNFTPQLQTDIAKIIEDLDNN